METVNFRHDSETLKENNDFLETSSFVGTMNPNIYYNCEDEISKFHIFAPNEDVDKKTFVKSSNEIPFSKCVSINEEHFTNIYDKYFCKIDCDGNVYKIDEEKNLVWIGYYNFERITMHKELNNSE